MEHFDRSFPVKARIQELFHKLHSLAALLSRLRPGAHAVGNAQNHLAAVPVVNREAVPGDHFPVPRHPGCPAEHHIYRSWHKHHRTVVLVDDHAAVPGRNHALPAGRRKAGRRLPHAHTTLFPQSPHRHIELPAAVGPLYLPHFPYADTVKFHLDLQNPTHLSVHLVHLINGPGSPPDDSGDLLKLIHHNSPAGEKPVRPEKILPGQLIFKPQLCQKPVRADAKGKPRKLLLPFFHGKKPVVRLPERVLPVLAPAPLHGLAVPADLMGGLL